MGLFDGLFSLATTSMTNGVNRSEAEYNRQWQERMYERQYADNINLWKMQNEYNTPSAQVQRLKDAGINPYLALGNVQTGSASSVPPAQAGNGAQATGVPAHMDGMAESLLALMRGKDERELLKAQAQDLYASGMEKRIDSMTKHQRNLAELSKMLSGSGKDAADAALSRSLQQTEDELRGYKKQQFVNETNESVLRQVTSWEQLKYLPTDKRLEYSERIANIALTNQLGSESRQTVRKMIEETNHEFFKGQGQKFINELNVKTERFIIDKMANDEYWSRKDPNLSNGYRWLEDIKNWLRK